MKHFDGAVSGEQPCDPLDGFGDVDLANSRHPARRSIR
jgi:hypothetical protein